MKYKTGNIGKAVSAYQVNFADTDTGQKWVISADADTEYP